MSEVIEREVQKDAVTPPIGPSQRLQVLPQEYLAFRLGNEEYGVDILRVQEIRRYEQPTRIANCPDYIKGVVNLRGVIVPIVDLRLKLQCAQAEFTDFTVVVVLNLFGQVIGAVVDSVSDVIALQPSAIKPPPEFNEAASALHVLGIGCVRNGDEERMLILTDIEQMVGAKALGAYSATSA